MTSTVVYEGALRTSAIHLRSENQIVTDAPVDNHGRGEAFSPTDLVATSLASCMMTVMGIKADQMGLDLGPAEARVEKVMASDPRRIARVRILFAMPHALDAQTRAVLERTARRCPVALSLHPDLEQDVTFTWG